MELLVWLRRTVTVILIGLIFYFFIDISELLAKLTRVNLRYYIAALTVSIISILVSVLRWQTILEYYDVNVEYTILTKIYMASIFYNLVLPGSLGGDAIKTYRITQQGEDRGKLIASVPLERISGLVALFPVLLIGIVYSRHILPQRIITVVTIVCFTALIGIFGLSSGIFEKVVIWATGLPIINKFDIRADAYSIVTAFQELRNPAFVFFAVGYSLIFVLLSIIVNYLFVLSTGAEIPLFYLAAVIPIQQILIQIPISIGGIGIKEGVFIYFFGLVGISPETAVLISALGYITQLVNSLIGGVIDLK